MVGEDRNQGCGCGVDRNVRGQRAGCRVSASEDRNFVSRLDELADLDR
jgi:hypothetical protein